MAGGVLAQRDGVDPLHCLLTITGPRTPRIFGPFHRSIELDPLDSEPASSETQTDECRPANVKKRRMQLAQLLLSY